MPPKKMNTGRVILGMKLGGLLIVLAAVVVLISRLTYAGNGPEGNTGAGSEERQDRKVPPSPPSASPATTPSSFIIVPDALEVSRSERQGEQKLKNEVDDGIKPEIVPPMSPLTAFFVNPLPLMVENPLIAFNGSKSIGSSILINNQTVVPQSESTDWNVTFLLSPGKNRIAFESKGNTGRSLGKSETEIIFKAQESVAAPILNTIKNDNPNLRSEIEKIVEKQIDDQSLNQEFPKVSQSTQQRVREVLMKENLSYMNISKSDGAANLSKFLSRESEKETSTQTFGGPRLTSSSHPNQNIWSSENEVRIAWERVDSALGYRIGVSSYPIDPTFEVPNGITNWSAKLPDGVWYFAVKAVVPEGVTLTNFYRLMIDTDPPKVLSLTVSDPYPKYKNGSSVNLKIVFSDNLIKLRDVENIPDSLPLGFIDEENLKNIAARQDILPEFSKLIEADFSILDSNFSKDRIMINSLKAGSDGSMEANVSYKISPDNRRGDRESLSILLAVKDFVGNKSYGSVMVSLENKTTPIKVDNLSDLSLPITQTALLGQGLILKGRASPNSSVVLLFYSENPITATVLTDNEGGWSYRLNEELPIGNHTVYAYVKKENAPANDTVQVASFFLVNEAQAKEIDELSKPISSFKPTNPPVLAVRPIIPPLPLAVKLALILYFLSFASLIAALVVWYRENPPHNL